MSVIVDLIEFKKNRNQMTERYVYFVMHGNGKTNLDQELVIERDRRGHGKWEASMVMKEFPGQDSKEEAALKLADWMERMAMAIKSEFGEKQEVAQGDD